MAADVSVLVVTYNSAADIATCLASIPAAFSAGERVEVILVDNASTDDTVAIVRALMDVDVNVIESPVNVGFARANNHAATVAEGRHVLLLNPDAALHAGSGTALLDYAIQHPHHGLYGGRAFRTDGALDPRSCWGLPTPWSSFCFAAGLSSAFRRNRVFDPTSLGRWERDTLREVAVISGCLLLARLDAWESLGGFDERYFLYGEDVDLGYRAKALGLRPIIVPDAAITHVGSASSPDTTGRTEMLLRGRSTFIRLRWTGARRAWGLGMLGIGVLLRAASERVRPGPRRWTTLWHQRATWWPGYGSTLVDSGAPCFP